MRCLYQLVFATIIIIMMIMPRPVVAVTEGELEEAKMPISLIPFAMRISGAEGGWTSDNSRVKGKFGCLGFFQLCPGTFKGLVGHGTCPNVSQADYKYNRPAQVGCFLQYHRGNWQESGQSLWGAAKGHKACKYESGGRGGPTDNCVNITPSSVAFGLQFGPGYVSGFVYGRNGQGAFACTPKFSGPKGGRDGNNTCTEHYFYLGAGFVVSAITDMPPSKEDDTALYMLSDPKMPIPGSPTDADGNPDPPNTIKPQPCVDLPLFRNMVEASRRTATMSITAAQQVYSKLSVQDMNVCLMKLTKYFDTIEAFLQGAVKNPFVAILFALVSGYLNQVCNYVMTTIISYIDTAICIPVPKLNLTLSLPSLQQGSCDGSGLTGLLSTFMTPTSMPSSTAPAPVNNMSTGAEAFKPDPSTSGNSAYKNYFNNPANK